MPVCVRENLCNACNYVILTMYVGVDARTYVCDMWVCMFRRVCINAGVRACMHACNEGMKVCKCVWPVMYRMHVCMCVRNACA